jgi:hypothetical protein
MSKPLFGEKPDSWGQHLRKLKKKTFWRKVRVKFKRIAGKHLSTGAGGTA